MEHRESRPPICDYEGSDYRTRFWEGKGRDYEDRAERIALRRLLTGHGRRLLEIGAGFGRLTDEYGKYEQVMLLDYSFSHLQQAQAYLGRTPRYTYVAADVYRLPFQAGVFDGATMIRVLHHMANVPLALAQIRRVLSGRACFILEHANKRNLKAILRYARRQQPWNPHDHAPIEFVELNFDFHPEYIRRELIKAHFRPQKRLPVSYLRVGALKERVPVSALSAAESALQLSGLLYSPSVFVQARADGAAVPLPEGDISALFACPQCGGALVQDGSTLVCAGEGLRYAIRDGIYDFKTPVDEG